MARTLQYQRTHIPTGNTYLGQFNATHHHVFGDPGGYPPRAVLSVARDLIDRWNRQQPDTWRYELLKEDV